MELISATMGSALLPVLLRHVHTDTSTSLGFGLQVNALRIKQQYFTTAYVVVNFTVQASLSEHTLTLC